MLELPNAQFPERLQGFLCQTPRAWAATAIDEGLTHGTSDTEGYEIGWIDRAILEPAFLDSGREPLGLGEHRLVLDDPERSRTQSALAAPVPQRPIR